jgi:hypothetical protein
VDDLVDREVTRAEHEPGGAPHRSSSRHDHTEGWLTVEPLEDDVEVDVEADAELCAPVLEEPLVLRDPVLERAVALTFVPSEGLVDGMEGQHLDVDGPDHAHRVR